LTEAGEMLYPAIRDGLDAIATSIAQLNRIQESAELTVSVINAFAAKWLVPRLSAFQQAHPDITLRLQTSNEVIDLRARTVDLAIRYGKGHYPGLSSRKLMSDRFIPVCSPQQLQGEYPLQQPSDLVYHPLLHFEWIHYGAEAPNWKNWLAAAQLDSIDPTRGVKFNEESLAIQAAIAGQGVALCSSIHVADDIACGFLVQPFEIALEGLTYSAVYLQQHPKEPFILKFIDWLTESASLLSSSTIC
jgi:LysR family glycine cleavage system transcriptional activator